MFINFLMVIIILQGLYKFRERVLRLTQLSDRYNVP